MSLYFFAEVKTTHHKTRRIHGGPGLVFFLCCIIKEPYPDPGLRSRSPTFWPKHKNVYKMGKHKIECHHFLNSELEGWDPEAPLTPVVLSDGPQNSVCCLSIARVEVASSGPSNGIRPIDQTPDSALGDRIV